MHLFIQVACFVAVLSVTAAAAALKDQCATAVLFNGKHFTKQPLAQGIAGDPMYIAVHDMTGDIFYTRRNDQASGDESMKLYVLKDGSGPPLEIKGGKGLGYVTAVDNDNDEVHFSIGNNRYNFIRDENRADPFEEDKRKHDDMIYMFYTNPARYVATSGDKLIKFTRSDRIELDRELYHGKNLVVDSKENFYFIGRSGNPYVTPKGATKKIELQVPGFNKAKETTFALDRNDNVFLTLENKLYKVKADNNVPEFVSDLEVTPTSIAFDKLNNPIIGYKGGITKYMKIDC